VSALDGLRVLAAVAVVLFHAALLRGGYIGVDVFFVISGFVITRLLLAQYDGHGLPLRRFYLDRLQRLAPPLLLMVMTVSLGIEAGLAPIAWLRWAPAAVTYTTDFLRIADGQTYNTAYAHTWSLAIEEQFYLVWPLALLVGLRRLRSRLALLAAVLAAAAVSIAIAVAWVGAEGANAASYRIYNGPDTRAVQLLAGCLLAIIVDGGDELARVRAVVLRLCRLTVPLALAFLVAWGGWAHETTYNYYAALALPAVAVATAVVIAVVITAHEHPLSRVLGARWLGAAGRRYSYSLYLWHFPAIILLARHMPGPGHVKLALAAGSAVIPAVASWHLLEQPLADLRHRRSRARRRAGTVAPVAPAPAVAATMSRDV
jgi:peptidoglycan/LPS O-acetylase OafA/YrhL